MNVALVECGPYEDGALADQVHFGEVRANRRLLVLVNRSLGEKAKGGEDADGRQEATKQHGHVEHACLYISTEIVERARGLETLEHVAVFG